MTSRRAKLRAKITQNPKNVRFEDLERLLYAYGFTMRQPHGGSSHHYFQLASKVGTLVQFTIPYHRPHFKAAYVKLVLETLETHFPEADDESEITQNDD